MIHDLAGVATTPEIELLAEHGLLGVDPAGDVHPIRVIARAAFVDLVMHALAYPNVFQPLSQAVSRSLTDVPVKSPTYNVIAFAY